MKNTRSYRLAAILLAAVIVFGAVPAMAGESFFTLNPGFNQGYTYDASAAAVFTYTSDGVEVGSAADLVPGKTNTMKITVPNSDGLPTDSAGVTTVKVPADVKLTSENAALCRSDSVTCSYNAVSRTLSFKWSGAAQEGFSATFPIEPDLPSTVNVSGRYVVVTVKANQTQIGAMKAQSRSDNRLVTSQISTYEGKMFFDDNSAHVWSFNHLSGDWYTISNNGSYLKMNNNALSLTDKAGATIFHIRSEANGYVIESNGYYLNTKGDNATNGMQGSNWSPMGQWVKLVSPDNLFAVAENDSKGYLKLSVNGGNSAIKPDVIIIEKSGTITLPNYSGTKNGKKFIGWSKYSNIYEYHDGKDNSYCEVYLPGSQYSLASGTETLYAVFEEKGTDVRFGFRIDGQIANEPGDHPGKEYTGHISVPNALKTGYWVVDVDGDKPVSGNHIENNVTANLTNLPTDAQIKEKMGNKYDPETMYVHWYVLKYAGQWKVDGVIRTRKSKSVGYDMNLNSTDRSGVQDMPKGFEYGQKANIKVGAESDGTVRIPTLEGYIFHGWNTKADGTGTAYDSGTEIEVTESVTFYAQWEQIPKYEVTYILIGADGINVETPAAASYEETQVVELPEAEDRIDYIFSGWTVNGKKIEGNSFTMGSEPVEVEGTYYGPISVRIESNWQDGVPGFPGARIVLKAVTECDEDLDYEFQWKYMQSGNWVDIPGATGDTISYELDEETSGRNWRVVVTNVRPHQD